MDVLYIDSYRSQVLVPILTLLIMAWDIPLKPEVDLETSENIARSLLHAGSLSLDLYSISEHPTSLLTM